MQKYNQMKNYKQKLQRGLTLIEITISSGLLFLVMGMGVSFFQNMNQAMQIAEQETKLQQDSRNAIVIINKELRQATAYYEVPFEGLPQAKEILFLKPRTNELGLINGYNLVRIWFQEGKNGVYSLLKAEKDHGTAAEFSDSDKDFAPDPEDLADKKAYRITTLVREATVIEPGKQSFFHQDPNQPHLINIRLVTAIYGRTENSQTGQLEVIRKFRVDGEVDARNLAL